MHDMGLDLDPQALVSTLSVGQQQMVEIVKAMSFAPVHPAAGRADLGAGGARRSSQLFELVRAGCKTKGVTMIYITHRMNELFEIADTCAVMRDGKFVGATEMSAATAEWIVEMMFGGVARAKRPSRRTVDRVDPVLSVQKPDVRRHVRRRLVRPLSRRGAGFRWTAWAQGARRCCARSSAPTHSTRAKSSSTASASRGRRHARMKRRGLGYTPENRKEVGLVQVLSIHDNLCLA